MEKMENAWVAGCTVGQKIGQSGDLRVGDYWDVLFGRNLTAA